MASLTSVLCVILFFLPLARAVTINVACCDLATLQTGVNSAGNGDILALDPGTFTYAGGGVTLGGTAKNLTVLGAPTTISSTVNPFSMNAEGYGDFFVNLLFTGHGPKIVVLNNASPSVVNCSFTGATNALQISSNANAAFYLSNVSFVSNDIALLGPSFFGTGLTFYNNSVAIRSRYSTASTNIISLSDVTFDSGSLGLTSSLANVFVAQGVSMTLTRAKFTSCNALPAMCIDSMGSLTLVQPAFIGLGFEQGSYGYAVRANGSSTVVSGGQATNCTCQILQLTGPSIVQDMIFTNNIERQVIIAGTTATVSGLKFSGLRVSATWNPLYCGCYVPFMIQSNSSVNISNISTFVPVRAIGYGLWVFGDNNNVSVSNSSFIGSGNGMGVTDGYSHVTVSNSFFSLNNRGMSLVFGTAYVYNSTFLNNGELSLTSWLGGAFLLCHATVIAHACNVTGNFAIAGGAFHVRAGSHMEVYDNVLSGNQVFISNVLGGGAVTVREQSSFTMARTTIVGSRLVDPSNGGCIAIMENATVSITDSSISSCTATYGGGLSIVGNVSLVLRNTAFSRNTATVNGGDIFQDNTGSTLSFTVDTCTFQNSQSASSGGSLYVTSPHTLNDSYWYQNNALSGAAGGAVYTTAALTVHRSIFRQNQAVGTGGGAIYFNAPGSKLAVDESTFWQNAVDNTGASILQVAGIAQISQSNYFDQNILLPNWGSRWEADFTAISGYCNLPPAGLKLEAVQCPGAPGYACDLECAEGTVQVGQSLCGASAPTFTGGACVSQDYVYSSWVGGSSSRGGEAINYGTQGVYAPTNQMGGRRGAAFAVFPQDPNSLLVFGGGGYNEANTSDGTGAGGITNSDTWRFGIGGGADMSRQTWLGGGRSQVGLAVANLTGPTPGGRRVLGMWTDDVANTAYVFGGNGASSTGIFKVLADVWRMSFSNLGVWTYLGGDANMGTGPAYQSMSLASAKGVYAAGNWPGGRSGPNVMKFANKPRFAFVHGGSSGAGFSIGDLWGYDMANNLWAWVGGSITGDLTPTVAGVRGVADPSNYPGSRFLAGMWYDGLKDVNYMFGGQSGASNQCSTNDLWSAYYNTTSQSIVWTWILGPTECGQYGGKYPPNGPQDGFCVTCFPPATTHAHLFMFPSLQAAGGDTLLYLYGGIYVSDYYSHVWAINVYDPNPGFMHLAGNRGSINNNNGYFVYPTFKAPLARYTPGPRATGVYAPDPTRLGVLHLMGGYSPMPTLRPTNDVWIMKFPLHLRITAPASTATLGVPFTVSGRILYPSGYLSSTLNLAVNVTARLIGTGATSAVSVSAFANGVISITLWGGAGFTTPGTASLMFNQTDVGGSTTVSVTCMTGCLACTGATLNIANCTSCDLASGYRRSLVTGNCVAACETGYYKNATHCTPCTFGCAVCTGPNLYPPDCVSCDATVNYGARLGICELCHVGGGGEYLDRGVCIGCPPVSNCAAPENSTCVSSSTTTCPLCLPNYFLVNHPGFSDTCSPCTTCLTSEYQVRACNATANSICRACTTCTNTQYRASACTPTQDAVCADCPAVPNCGGTVTCTSASDVSCPSCVTPGYFLKHTAGQPDQCLPCGTCEAGAFVQAPCQGTSNVTCAACQFGCAACTGASLFRPTCQRCDESRDYRLDVSGVSCVPSCGAHEWTDASVAGAAQCVACHAACASCDGTGPRLKSAGGRCDACDEAHGALLAVDEVTCVSECSVGEYQNKTAEPYHCSPCSGSVCPSNEYVSCTDSASFTCTLCDTGCASCRGPGLLATSGGGYCDACDHGYTVDPTSSTCVPCAANCTSCSGSATTCTECANGYANLPGCAPVCDSPGCLTCVAPDSCASICEPQYAGDNCKKCSSLAALGAKYPDCQPARTTDVTGTSSSMGILGLLVLLVLFFVLRFPLDIFYKGSQLIVTPNARLPLFVDFILSTRHLTLRVDSEVKVDSVTLEGTGLLPGANPLKPKEKDINTDYNSYEIIMNLTEKQTRSVLSGGWRVVAVADAGLGPVKTSHVVRFPLRMNGANALALLTIIIEFIQLSSFCFGDDIQWWTSDPVPHTLRYSLITLPALNGLWYITFWLFASVALIFTIFVIVLKLRLDRNLYKHRAYAKFANLLYGTVLPFIGTTLYMPIISSMLSVMACSKPVTDASAPYTANFAPNSVACWQGDHLIYAVISALTILTFYPLAVFTLPVWQTVDPELDVRYFPKYLIATGQVKFVLAVSNQMFANIPYLLPILLITFSVPVIIFVLYKAPSVIYRLRWVVLASYTCVAWAGISALIASVFVPDSYISALVLYGGWGLVMIVCLVLEIRPAKANVSEAQDDATGALHRVFGGHDADGAALVSASSGGVPTKAEAYLSPSEEGETSKPSAVDSKDADVVEGDGAANSAKETISDAVEPVKELEDSKDKPEPDTKSKPAAKKAAAKGKK